MPLQYVPLWFVLRPELAEQRRLRAIQRGIRTLLASGDVPDRLRAGRVHEYRHDRRRRGSLPFPGQPQQAPDRWFAYASLVGLGVDLELLTARNALTGAERLDVHLDVAVNLYPCAVIDPRARAILLESAISPLRTVVEITEHSVVADYRLLLAALASLRQEGVRVAIDDTGAGYSSFVHVLALAPGVIRLDRVIITGLEHDPARRALVRLMVGYAAECGAVTVGQGVETAAELACVQGLQIDLVQGFWTGRPSTEPDVWATWTAPPRPVARSAPLVPAVAALAAPDLEPSAG